MAATDAGHERVRDHDVEAAGPEVASAREVQPRRSRFWQCTTRSQDSAACSELQSLAADAAAAAEQAVQQLFAGLASEARQKQQQRQALRLSASSAKANREALYLEPHQRARWEASSRSFLSRALERQQECDAASLQRLAALQHFLEVDMEDLRLPAQQRCSEDEFLNEPPLQDVCSQFLMDVTRGVYIVDGRRYVFQEDLLASGLDLELQSDEVERLKEDFATRVAVHVRQCLTAEQDCSESNILVQAATAILSQSGLANIERACGEQVVVSGGEQELLFELRRGPLPGNWDLRLAMKKVEFGSCMVCGQPEDEVEILPCGAGSRIARSSTLRLTANASVEVLELQAEMELLDELGRPLSLPGKVDGDRRRSSQLLLQVATAFSLMKALPVRCAARCGAGVGMAGRGATWARRQAAAALLSCRFRRLMSAPSSAATAEGEQPLRPRQFSESLGSEPEAMIELQQRPGSF